MSPLDAAGEQWRMIEGSLLMSRKERKRLAVLAQVKRGELKLVTAGEVMAVSYRQAKRVWRRYRVEGDAGLVHRSRGRPSPRRKPPELRQRVLARYEQRYPDFGPTLAAEYLAGEGLAVDHETLRRWLIAQGTRSVRRRGQQHRAWRERKACFGMMVQLDGSHHDWFEGRRAPAVLMVMVDDATNQVWAQFFEAETTRASYDVLEGWVRRRGLPQSLYVDRDSIYRCEGVGSVAEQLAGQAPQTQFGRAMEQLGVELILEHFHKICSLTRVWAGWQGLGHMQAIPVPMRQRILQLYEQGKEHPPDCGVFRLLCGGGAAGAPAVPGAGHAGAANPLVRAQDPVDRPAPSPAAKADRRPTRRHVGRTGRAHGPPALGLRRWICGCVGWG